MRLLPNWYLHFWLASTPCVSPKVAKIAPLGRVPAKQGTNTFEEDGRVVTRVSVVFSADRVVPEVEPGCYVLLIDLRVGTPGRQLSVQSIRLLGQAVLGHCRNLQLFRRPA